MKSRNRMCNNGIGCSGKSSEQIACNEHDCSGKVLTRLSNLLKIFYISQSSNSLNNGFFFETICKG